MTRKTRWVFAEGSGQEMFAGQLDNTDVPKVIAAAVELTLGADRGGTRATERATVAGNGAQQAGPETCAREPSGGQRPPATAQELISRPEQVQAVRDFVASGGRLLATGQASLKTEDEGPGGFYGFQLADVLGVAFVGWQEVVPLHSCIVPPAACRNGAMSGSTLNAVASNAVPRATSSAPADTAPGVVPGSGQGASAAGAAPDAARGSSPAKSFSGESASGTLGERARNLDPGAALRTLWAGIEAPLQLPRPQGVVARCLPGAVALGAWADADGGPTHPDPFNVAAAANGATLYIGADVLSRDVLSDPAVRAFARNAIRCLLRLQAVSTSQ